MTNDFFRRRKTAIIAGTAAGALSSIALFVVFGVIVFSNEGGVFGYFASRYVEEIRDDVHADEFTDSNIPVTQNSLVVQAVEEANPAVVAIVATKDVPIIEEYYQEYDPFRDFFGGDPFGGFQFRVPQYREHGTEERQVGGGSGFIVTEDGLAVTNRHVVADPEASYTAFSSDGTQYDVEIIDTDPVADIAVIQLDDGDDLPTLSFGNSDNVKLGQAVIAIGNALGEFRNTVSVGVVSGLARSIVAGGPGGGQTEYLEGVIQTDAAINPGNSGGPLLDLRGRVIAVNVAVATGSENIGFAIPSNIVKSIVESVNKHGEIVRPFLGVRYMPVTPALAEQNDLPVDYGALLTKGDNGELAILPGSPADKAGLEENDIILEIDGVRLSEGRTLAGVIRRKEIGETITIKVLHDGSERDVKVTLEESPND